MDTNSKRAIELYRRAKAERLRTPGAGSLAVDVRPLHRVARADAVDLTHADPSCKRCHGTGLLGHRLIPGNRGCEPVRIPLVCRCVVRRGGFKQPTPKGPAQPIK